MAEGEEPRADAAGGPPQEITCEACGATNTEDDEVCKSCGEALWEDSDDEEGSPEGWKPLLVGGILAAVVLGLFLWKPWVKGGAAGTTSGGAPVASGPTNEVHDIRQDGDLIWIGTSAGAFAHDRKTLEKVMDRTDGLLHPFIDALVVDHNGTKWFGTFGGGLDYYDNKEWKSFPTDTTQRATIINAFEDRKGVLWFLSDAAGVFMLDPDRTTWHQYMRKDGLPHDAVHAFAEEKDGSVWLGTTDGVAHVKDKKWTVYTTKDGLALNHVLVILIDAKGGKWFGTWGGGLSYFDGKGWQTYRAGPGSINSDFVLSGRVDAQGRVWLGTYEGVSMWDGSQWHQYREAEGVLGTDVWATEIDTDGNKWFGTYKGVTRLSADDKEWKTIVR
jgi:streptogramin lyase